MATFAPHVARAVKEINDRFPALGEGGTYPGHGEDGSQYAADFWSTVKSVHDAAFPWLRANAKRLGIKYIISWERIWSVARADEGVRPYTRYPGGNASQLHTNHIHVSFNVTPPGPVEPPKPQLGVPLMANAEPIRITYHDDQPLTSIQAGYVHINADKHTSVVVGESEGVDCTAILEFEGLKEGEYVRIFWRKVWKKKDTADKIIRDDLSAPAVPYDEDTWSAQVRYADSLPKADTGWTACLRLCYLTDSSTAVVVRRQFRGWKLT